MVFKLTNIDDPMERLKRAIVIVTEKIVDDERTEHVNERILNRIVIEFTKTLYTKEVDEENKRVISSFIKTHQQNGRNCKRNQSDYPFAKV
jgi:hypothetical protein